MGRQNGRKKLLQEWLEKYDIKKKKVPLFDTKNDGLTVNIKSYGLDDRPNLKRSQEMEALVESEVGKVVEDHSDNQNKTDGILYLLLNENNELIYVNITPKYSRNENDLSASLQNISENMSKFARWGDGQYYYIGELSAAAFDHHQQDDLNRRDPPSDRFQTWHDKLFVSDSNLIRPVYFWAKAWKDSDVGLHGFNTSLEGIKSQLIDVSMNLYPEKLLNENN